MSEKERAQWLDTRQKQIIKQFNSYAPVFKVEPIETKEEFVEQFNLLVDQHYHDDKKATKEYKNLHSIARILQITSNILTVNRSYLDKQQNVAKTISVKNNAQHITEKIDIKSKNDTESSVTYGPETEQEYYERYGQMIENSEFMFNNQIPPKIYPKNRKPN